MAAKCCLIVCGLSHLYLNRDRQQALRFAVVFKSPKLSILEHGVDKATTRFYDNQHSRAEDSPTFNVAY